MNNPPLLSKWEVIFPDGRTIYVDAGDIVSCINVLLQLKEPVEEAVSFDCLE